jgi:hypothetical protein
VRHGAHWPALGGRRTRRVAGISRVLVQHRRGLRYLWRPAPRTEANRCVPLGNLLPAAHGERGGVLAGDVEGVVLSTVVYGQPRRIAALGTLPVWRRAASSASSPCWDPARPPSGADFLCDTYRMGTSQASWSKPYPFDDVAQHFYVNLGTTTSPVNVAALLEDVRRRHSLSREQAADYRLEQSRR